LHNICRYRVVSWDTNSTDSYDVHITYNNPNLDLAFEVAGKTWALSLDIVTPAIADNYFKLLISWKRTSTTDFFVALAAIDSTGTFAEVYNTSWTGTFGPTIALMSFEHNRYGTLYIYETFDHFDYYIDPAEFKSTIESFDTRLLSSLENSPDRNLAASSLNPVCDITVYANAAILGTVGQVLYDECRAWMDNNNYCSKFDSGSVQCELPDFPTANAKGYCDETWGDGRFYGIGALWDDGNLIDGDGWDSFCEIEYGFDWIVGNESTPSVCTPSVCGDGVRTYNIASEWDDANTISGDGCSSTWAIEFNFRCVYSDTHKRDICKRIRAIGDSCGDGKLYVLEQWDDLNRIDGDGCSSSCKIETGYTCTHNGLSSTWDNESSSSADDSSADDSTSQKYSVGPLDDSLLNGADGSAGTTTTILAVSSLGQMKPNGNFWAMINFLQTLRPFALLKTTLPENLKAYIGGETKLVSFNFDLFTDLSSNLTSSISLDFNFNDHIDSDLTSQLNLYDFGTVSFLSYLISCIMWIMFPVIFLLTLYLISILSNLWCKRTGAKIKEYSKVNLCYNIHIRFFHEVSINIFVIALLNIRFYDYSFKSASYFVSYLTSIIFVMFSFVYMYKLRRYFKTHEDPEEWNPGFFEVYNGLNLKSKNVLEFLYIFFGKRLIFSFTIALYDWVNPNVQISILLVTFTSSFIYQVFVNLFDNRTSYLINIFLELTLVVFTAPLFIIENFESIDDEKVGRFMIGAIVICQLWVGIISLVDLLVNIFKYLKNKIRREKVVDDIEEVDGEQVIAPNHTPVEEFKTAKEASNDRKPNIVYNDESVIKIDPSSRINMNVNNTAISYVISHDEEMKYL
jgi:cysteine-rich repeat protein